MLHTFRVLKTKRLLLREIVPEDIQFIFKGLSVAQVIRHFGLAYYSPEATEKQMRWYADIIVKDTGRCWAMQATVFFMVYAHLTFKKKNTAVQKPVTGFFHITEAMVLCPKL